MARGAMKQEERRLVWQNVHPTHLVTRAGEVVGEERSLHAGERAARGGAYADTQMLQHAVSSLSAARINPRGVRDSVKLRSARVLLACAGKRALYAGEREACSGTCVYNSWMNSEEMAEGRKCNGCLKQ